MEIPEYVSKAEVQRVCAQLCIRYWTTLSDAEVEYSEAESLRELVGGEALSVSVEEFQLGLKSNLSMALDSLMPT